MARSNFWNILMDNAPPSGLINLIPWAVERNKALNDAIKGGANFFFQPGGYDQFLPSDFDPGSVNNADQTWQQKIESFLGNPNDFGDNTQHSNNYYSYLEMMFRNELEQNNAANANQIAQHNAEVQFERQKELAKLDFDNQVKLYNLMREDQYEREDSAWQRGVADMKAAGINPILAYSQGGASSASVGIPAFDSGSASSAYTVKANAEKQTIDFSSAASLQKSLMQVVSSAASIGLLLASKGKL